MPFIFIELTKLEPDYDTKDAEREVSTIVQMNLVREITPRGKGRTEVVFSRDEGIIVTQSPEEVMDRAVKAMQGR